MNRITQTFFELVKIDSPSGEEKAVGEYICDYLEKLNIPSEFDSAGNLLARVDGNGEPLLLCAHMDTVEPGRGIEPVIVDGVIKSAGETILGADDKAAVAAILETLHHVDGKNNRSLEILFTVREETNGGINDFDMSQLKSKFGVIADRSSPIGSIVTSSPWLVDIRITITGKAAHSATPEKGMNAFNAVLDLFSEMRSGRLDEDTTFNIGTIHGGDAINTIPGKMSLAGDMRSFSKEKLDSHLERLKDAVERIQSDIRIDLKIVPYGSGYVFQEDDEAIRLVTDAMESLGILPKLERSFGGSDANTLIENGIFAVNIGDGSVGAHTLEESIAVEDLELLSKLFLAYIKQV